MANDIIIDTCVMIHAERGCPENPRHQQHALQLLKLLNASDDIEILFDLNSKRPITALSISTLPSDYSLLFYEYRKHLDASGLGMQLLQALLAGGRVAFLRISEYISNSDRITAISLIKGTKPTDRKVLQLACISRSRTLVTHDFEDFQAGKRATIKKQLNVIVLTAKQALG